MVDLYEFLVQNHVAPLTGAWIKIEGKTAGLGKLPGRIPRGCVD